MNEQVMLAVVGLLALEDTGVRVTAKGGAYGSARLVLVDTTTGNEYSLAEAIEAAGKAGYDVSTYEG